MAWRRPLLRPDRRGCVALLALLLYLLPLQSHAAGVHTSEARQGAALANATQVVLLQAKHGPACSKAWFSLCLQGKPGAALYTMVQAHREDRTAGWASSGSSPVRRVRTNLDCCCAGAPQWAQCGGLDSAPSAAETVDGPWASVTCPDSNSCKRVNAHYYQCTPFAPAPPAAGLPRRLANPLRHAHPCCLACCCCVLSLSSEPALVYLTLPAGHG